VIINEFCCIQQKSLGFGPSGVRAVPALERAAATPCRQYTPNVTKVEPKKKKQVNSHTLGFMSRLGIPVITAAIRASLNNSGANSTDVRSCIQDRL
jgi:hypothetical protein